MWYVLIGTDSPAQESQLATLKASLLPKELETFNLDTLYARDLTLRQLQERFLTLPLQAAQRLLVIRDADALSAQPREFLLRRAENPPPHLALILIFSHFNPKDALNAILNRVAKVLRVAEHTSPDTFVLNRQIESRRPDAALRILNQLLIDGEKPEMILGGLRYLWERKSSSHLEAQKRLKLLLRCDREIKTGRLKPLFALEKLVISMCVAKGSG